MVEIKKESRALFRWFVFVALLLIKLLALYWYGPSSEPDWGGYRMFAKLIMESDQWQYGMDYEITAYRALGYPMLVAFWMKVAGGYYEWFVISTQIVMSLIATYMVFLLGRALFCREDVALLVALMHALAITFTYDQMLLTDSLFGSLFLISWIIPALLFILGSWCPCALFMAGFCYSCAIVTRGIGVYLLILVIPIVLLVILLANDRRSRLIGVMAFSMPIMLTCAIYSGWNYLRSGSVFITTGAQVVMLQPLVKIAAHGVDIFDTESELDRIADLILKRYSYEEAVRIHNTYAQMSGKSSPELANLESSRYFTAVQEHPWEVIKNGLRNYNGKIIRQFFNPVENYIFYTSLVMHNKIWPGTKKIVRQIKQSWNPSSFFWLMLVVTFRILSFVWFVCFLLITPFTIVTVAWTRCLSRREQVVAYCWFLFISYTFGLCLLHWVLRFVIAVLPAGLLAAWYGISSESRKIVANQSAIAK